jgi:hypothetical protein
VWCWNGTKPRPRCPKETTEGEARRGDKKVRTAILELCPPVAIFDVESTHSSSTAGGARGGGGRYGNQQRNQNGTILKETCPVPVLTSVWWIAIVVVWPEASVHRKRRESCWKIPHELMNLEANQSCASLLENHKCYFEERAEGGTGGRAAQEKQEEEEHKPERCSSSFDFSFVKYVLCSSMAWI